MATSTVFTNNRSQAVRLPAELRFPDGIKQVNARALGNERSIAPLPKTWNSFFLDVPDVSQDFMEAGASQEIPTRESF